MSTLGVGVQEDYGMSYAWCAAHKPRDIKPGMRFTRWTATSYARPKSRSTYAIDVVCDCGNAKTVCPYALLDGRTMSCGCLQRELTGHQSRRVYQTSVPEHGMPARYSTYGCKCPPCNAANNEVARERRARLAVPLTCSLCGQQFPRRVGGARSLMCPACREEYGRCGVCKRFYPLWNDSRWGRYHCPEHKDQRGPLSHH